MKCQVLVSFLFVVFAFSCAKSTDTLRSESPKKQEALKPSKALATANLYFSVLHKGDPSSLEGPKSTVRLYDGENRKPLASKGAQGFCVDDKNAVNKGALIGLRCFHAGVKTNFFVKQIANAFVFEEVVLDESGQPQTTVIKRVANRIAKADDNAIRIQKKASAVTTP